jgi:hypothetical protein
MNELRDGNYARLGDLVESGGERDAGRGNKRK